MNHRMGFPAVLKALDTDSFDDLWSQSQRYPLGTPRRVSAALVLPAVVVELIPAQREQVASPSVRQITHAYFNLNGALVVGWEEL